MKMVVLFLLLFVGLTARAANWYVDNSVTISGNGQSWSSAFQNFSNIAWSSIQPGDSIFISGGVTSQTYTSTLDLGASGTVSSRILIRVGQDIGHNGTVILDGVSISSNYQNYFTIDGSVGTNSRLKIQNVTDASKDNGWAIEALGAVGVTVRYVTITNCNNAINLTYGDNFEIDHNSFTTRGDVGIRNIMAPDMGWDRNLIHDNSLTSLFNGGGPDTIQVGNSTSIYNNTIQVIQDASALTGQHTDNLQLAGRYVKVFGNSFTNVGDSNIDYDAWADGAIQDVYIYNNLFHIATQIDPYPEFIRMYTTGLPINIFSNVKILNNTFIDDIGGVRMIGFSFGNGTGAGDGNEIRNNLAKGSSSMGFNVDSSSGFTVSLSNNIYPGQQTVDTTAIIGVPSLDSNFIPTATDTLARDRGATLSYFSTDKLGTSRPQGSAWDIGAFEYSVNNSVKLLPPTNLRVQ
ncbi:MAG: choice-of-anchor Q domain-containing protein [Bdellovibrio sp.]